MERSIWDRGFSPVKKRISSNNDMKEWRLSSAYNQILELIGHISESVALTKVPESTTDEYTAKLVTVIDHLHTLIDETPPQEGPRRFGNVAFRTWLDKVTAAVEDSLMKEIYASHHQNDPSIELNYYFLNSFGSRQRLDYGTGHELSFLAFVGALYMLGLYGDPSGESWLLVFSKYFELVRKLITTYNLEPAGSHGVWGLDDHFHLPYIFGAAELIDLKEPHIDVPGISPKDVTNKDRVRELSKQNLYFGAIQFIYELKKGPFHEHSPILFDVSGVPNWQKVFKGMFKMYNAEVLNKFPVIQHFYFGKGLYRWRTKDDMKLPSSEPDSDSESD